MPKSVRISIPEQLDQLQFLANRTPTTTSEESCLAFARLSEYGDGGIFVGHYAGNSEWEGDELVCVIDGETTLILLEDKSERSNFLIKGDCLIVPENTWHRFESPQGVKIMTVTPQPTDHCVHFPEPGQV